MSDHSGADNLFAVNNYEYAQPYNLQGGDIFTQNNQCQDENYGYMMAI